MGDAERENDDKKNIRFAPRRDDPDPSSPLYVQVPSLVLGRVLKKNHSILSQTKIQATPQRWASEHRQEISFCKFNLLRYPIPSMYGIFTYIYHKNQPNVGKYTSPMDGSWVFNHPFCISIEAISWFPFPTSASGERQEMSHPSVQVPLPNAHMYHPSQHHSFWGFPEPLVKIPKTTPKIGYGYTSLHTYSGGKPDGESLDSLQKL